MNGRVVVLVLAWPLLSGCAHNGAGDRAFTREWAYERNRADERAERMRRLKGDEELVLVGKEGGARAAVYMDEKGRPRFNVGKKRGLSADVDVDTDEADVKLKYKLGWKPKRPKR